jgi:ketosteroid isomerase-like protein
MQVALENVEIARRVFDARNRGDLAAMLPYAAPDIEFDFTASAGPWTGTHRGRERLIDSFGSLAEAFDQLRWEAEEFIDAGDAVVVPVRFYARGRESGIETSTRAVQVYWLKDGKIVRYQLCESRADALEAVRLAEG